MGREDASVLEKTYTLFKESNCRLLLNFRSDCSVFETLIHFPLISLSCSSLQSFYGLTRSVLNAPRPDTHFSLPPLLSPSPLGPWSASLSEIDRAPSFRVPSFYFPANNEDGVRMNGGIEIGGFKSCKKFISFTKSPYSAIFFQSFCACL